MLPLWVAIYFRRKQRCGHSTTASSISDWERDQLKPRKLLVQFTQQRGNPNSANCCPLLSTWDLQHWARCSEYIILFYRGARAVAQGYTCGQQESNLGQTSHLAHCFRCAGKGLWEFRSSLREATNSGRPQRRKTLRPSSGTSRKLLPTFGS